MLISYLDHKNLLSKLSPNNLLQALGLVSVVDGDDVQTVLSQERILREISGGVALVNLDVEIFNHYMRSSRRLVRELGLNSGDHAVIVNGRVSGFILLPVSLLLMHDVRLLALLDLESLWLLILRPCCHTSSVNEPAPLSKHWWALNLPWIVWISESMLFEMSILLNQS